MQSNKVGFIGGGFMGEALLSGLIAGSFCKPEDITVTDVRDERLKELRELYKVNTEPENSKVAAGSGVLVLAVKPQQMEDVLKEIADHVDQNAIVVSIAAGVTVSTIASQIKGKIVRAMPNMCAQVGESATALCGAGDVRDNDLALVVKMFDCVGKSVVVSESLMDAVTGLSGSGPAYIYLVMEALIKAGTDAGLSAVQSRDLVLQTVKGAAKMADETGEEPEVLRKRIMSPQGTTVAALDVLDSHSARSAFELAVAAAVKRSKELG